MFAPRTPKIEEHINIYGRSIYIVAIIFTIGMFVITSSVLLAAPKNDLKKNEKAGVEVQMSKEMKDQ